MKYATKLLVALTAVLAAGLWAACPAFADGGSPVSAPDGTLRYQFDGRYHPTLMCEPLHVCDVALQAGETVLNLAIGDSVRWVVAAGESGTNGSVPHVFVKPTEMNLQTNLLVTTTKRVYYIKLVSSASAPYPRISFSYPDDAVQLAEAQAEAQRQQAAEDAATLPLRPASELDYAYRIVGDKSIRPSKVYNDGVHSYIEFENLPNDLPVLLAVAEDGSDQIVNYRLKGNIFIVDSLSSGYDLVLNAGTGRHGRGERRVHIRHL